MSLDDYRREIYRGFVPSHPADIQGWNSDVGVLGDFVREIRPSVVIDVGVWKGASAIHFASLLRDNGIDGIVIAVDTFLGSPEHWEGGLAQRDMPPRRHGVPVLYEQFMANVVHKGLEDYVVPFPQTSTNAAIILKRWGVKADLVHIDAAHDYDSVLQDARAYWELLNEGGCLIGDDYVSSWPSVMMAADKFAAEMGADLLIASPKWIMRKA